MESDRAPNGLSQEMISLIAARKDDPDCWNGGSGHLPVLVMDRHSVAIRARYQPFIFSSAGSSGLITTLVPVTYTAIWQNLISATMARR